MVSVTLVCSALRTHTSPWDTGNLLPCPLSLSWSKHEPTRQIRISHLEMRGDSSPESKIGTEGQCARKSSVTLDSTAHCPFASNIQDIPNGGHVADTQLGITAISLVRAIIVRKTRTKVDATNASLKNFQASALIVGCWCWPISLQVQDDP